VMEGVASWLDALVPRLASTLRAENRRAALASPQVAAPVGAQAQLLLPRFASTTRR
jgi:hypothetical protein